MIFNVSWLIKQHIMDMYLHLLWNRKYKRAFRLVYSSFFLSLHSALQPTPQKKNLTRLDLRIQRAFCRQSFRFIQKVKQSHYRSGRALRVPGSCGSRISRRSAYEGGKVVSPVHRPLLTPQEIFLVLISVRGWDLELGTCSNELFFSE